jgi:hypothetical protein
MLLDFVVVVLAIEWIRVGELGRRRSCIGLKLPLSIVRGLPMSNFMTSPRSAEGFGFLHSESFNILMPDIRQW